ncbi:hypothetical protein V2G26_017660 [Clonostachys chloroleuca]|uniref:N-acetyltransferase domain-containing protein n=1 Tax=Clonostachys chloroleuca TaxID=1926264 RepID=A0AA35Q6E4_9HYPO|nr:unnamed protein product [Clonostachys chloroleuca]
MPAMLEDPTSPPLYRRSGAPPFPGPDIPPSLPLDIIPRTVTLRDRQTVATIVPFASCHQLPATLLVYLCEQLNKEIEGGDTYPMLDLFDPEDFAKYWFQNFGAVMLLGNIDGPQAVVEGKDWGKECLGSFYIKPNYPGRSSHVCNGGFLVTDASRGRGVGRLMGETYLDWAPRLGYTYSVFNLVYETNVASCRIWDGLGFKRIGRVKGCGNLKSHPDRFIDAIIYGRDLTPIEAEELVSEERFDKIKFYLKYGKYPDGADRAEKSRLRSAATHYKLLDDDKLMLKDKEVISDPAQQYEISRNVHTEQHAGINKTTATIAEKYHWSRIKETVSDVIRNCPECKDLGKSPNSGSGKRGAFTNSSNMNPPVAATVTLGGGVDDHVPPQGTPGNTTLLGHPHAMMPTLSHPDPHPGSGGYANPNDLSTVTPSHTFHHNPMLQDHHYSDPPADSQIINHHHNHHHDNPFDSYQAQDFQALLNATGDDVDVSEQDADASAVDRDLDMLIQHGDDDDDDPMGGLGNSTEKDKRVVL